MCPLFLISNNTLTFFLLLLERVACYSICFCPVREKKVRFLTRTQRNHEKVLELACLLFDVLDFDGSACLNCFVPSRRSVSSSACRGRRFGFRASRLSSVFWLRSSNDSWHIFLNICTQKEKKNYRWIQETTFIRDWLVVKVPCVFGVVWNRFMGLSKTQEVFLRETLQATFFCVHMTSQPVDWVNSPF